MSLRREVELMKARQRGFEQAMTNNRPESYATGATADEREAYRAGKEAGEEARESIEKSTIHRILREAARDKR